MILVQNCNPKTVKSSPKVDIIFRRFEFFFVSQLLAVPVLAYQLLANAKFEATRVVPFVFSMLWRTKAVFADSISQIKAARS